MLEDIAFSPQGEVISEETASALNVTLRCSARPSWSPSTGQHHIVDGAGKKADITSRAEQIRRQVEDPLRLRREKLQERLTKLAGGVCGESSRRCDRIEVKEKKDRARRAPLHPRRCRRRHRSGGGVALLRASKNCPSSKSRPRRSERRH